MIIKCKAVRNLGGYGWLENVPLKRELYSTKLGDYMGSLGEADLTRTENDIYDIEISAEEIDRLGYTTDTVKIFFDKYYNQ